MIMTRHPSPHNSTTLEASYHHGSSPLSDPTSNTISRAFLFGHPISHSLAPTMHHKLWNNHSPPLPWTFSLLDSVSKDDCLTAVHDPTCVGCSITMPHKLSLLPHIDDLTDEARVIGAINTIFVRLDPHTRERRYIGTNTDWIGIRDAFIRTFPAGVRESVRLKAALVVGAGGTARAAVYALWKFFGVVEIYIVNRFEDEVQELVSSMRAKGCGMNMKYVRSVEDAKCLRGPAIAVGTVPDIPAVTEEERQAEEAVGELLSRGEGADEGRGWLLDMCYHPTPATRLIKMARKEGWQTVSGIEALKYQGMAQNELWSEKKILSTALEELSRVIDAAFNN